MKLHLVFLLFAVSLIASAQERYFTKSGVVIFESDAPLEKIKAENRRVVSVVDFSAGQIEFSLLIRSFEFKKALMQEHFNEEFMESDKFPKAVFKGKIHQPESVNLKKDGRYEVTVSGELTMHGVTNNVTTQAFFSVKNGKLSAESTFTVKVADYNIKIPSLMTKNIAEEIQINVSIPQYEILQK
jgi:polyisoprenoid-binding protein YceI